MANISSPPQCRLLKFPAELRNTIYELVFAIDDETNTVEIRDASPPSKALLLTCKQVYGETRKIHQDAHRYYWTTGTFVLDLRARPLAATETSRITALSSRDLEHVGGLEVNIKQEDDDYGPVYQHLTLENEGWAWIWKLSQGGTPDDLEDQNKFFLYRDGIHRKARAVEYRPKVAIMTDQGSNGLSASMKDKTCRRWSSCCGSGIGRVETGRARLLSTVRPTDDASNDRLFEAPTYDCASSMPSNLRFIDF